MQGCDVWLNNPRKPLEASGTSGMKAAMNGVPHLSIGDGWWAEGYNGAQRLADRGPRRPDDQAAIDAADADSLYTLLEEEVVPAFYDRDDTDCRPAGCRSSAKSMRSMHAALFDPADGEAVRHGDVRPARHGAPLARAVNVGRGQPGRAAAGAGRRAYN